MSVDCTTKFPICGSVMNFTDRASQEIIKMVERKRSSDINTVVGIKVSLRAGCAGNKYTMEYVYGTPDVDDVLSFECVSSDKKVNVFINKHDVILLIGTEVDYEEGDIESGFVFRNPNAKSMCGCKRSFGV